MSILPKEIYRFSAIPIKIPVHLQKQKNLALNSCEISRDPQQPKTILKNKKKKLGGLTLLDFKIYCRATVIKTVWCQHRDRPIDQQNRIESPEINLHIYGQLIFNKAAKTTEWEKDSLSPGAGKTGPLLHTVYKNEVKMD